MTESCDKCKEMGYIINPHKFCRFCGKDFDEEILLSDYSASGIITASFGYGSEYDNQLIKPDKYEICDQCYKKHILDNLKK